MSNRTTDRPNHPRGLIWAAALLLAAGGAFGCQSPPDPEPIAASAITPAAGERVVDQVVILLDTSGSIDEYDEFPQVRAMLQSFVGSMPEGSYEVGVIAFGGIDRDVYAPAVFDRELVVTYVEEIDHLDDGTPLHIVLAETQEYLVGRGSKAAVIVVTDGLPSDVIGRDVPSKLVFDAARKLREGYAGTLCIHTLQVGSDVDGTAFLTELASTTECGSSRGTSSLDTAAAIQDFGRDSLLVSDDSVPDVAAAGPRRGIDSDRDGVADYGDDCLGTPPGVLVDARGCWLLPEPHFAFSSTAFEPGSEEGLEDVVLPVLEENPDLRLRVAGHTDASGDPNYNLYLSEKRAEAVRTALVARGISADRIETVGYGSQQPIAPDDSPENRRINRRTEITVLQ
jgi:OOP family OmpA-OmpF porin